MRGGPDAGEHQQLGRVQRARRQDHLLTGVDVVPLLVANQLHAIRPLRLRINQNLTDGRTELKSVSDTNRG